MKIMVLSSLGVGSGCRLRAGGVARALSEAGHTVITPRTGPGYSFWTDLFWSLFSFPIQFMISRPDILIGIKPYPNVGLAALLARIFGARVVIDIDDLDHGYRGGILSGINRILQAPVPYLANLVTCHNDNLEEYIKERWNISPNKMARLPQGVDTKLFSPQHSAKINKSELYEQLDCLDKKLFVYTAHLNIAAGLEDILKAWERVQLERSDCFLLIVGGGPMEEHFREMASRMDLANYYFTGTVEQLEVPEYIAAAEACLVFYPDLKVNLYRTSMKLREYLAMAKPVITNGVGDLAAFPEYSFISPDPSPESFAQTIIDSCEKLGPQPQARKMIVEKLDWNKIGRELAARLENLVNG